MGTETTRRHSLLLLATPMITHVTSLIPTIDPDWTGPRLTDRWVVLYGNRHPLSFWAALQTREEAVWQAYLREQLGWRARIIEPEARYA